MSNLITVARVQQYRANVQTKYQRQGSLLHNAVRFQEIKAKYHFWELLAQTAATKKTVRHGPTILVNSQHERRRSEFSDYEWSDLIDSEDKLRMIIDPESDYVTNASYAMGRALDQEIINSFDALAYEGETGSSSVAWAVDGPGGTGNIIVNGGTGLTVGKLRQTMQLLDSANVGPMDRFFAMSPIGKQDLLEDAQVTSTDFASVKALVNGEVDTYMGFKFIMHTGLSKAANIRTCWAWSKNAVGVHTPNELSVDIGPRRDLSNAIQVLVKGSYGAVRIQGAGVVQIDIDESA